ncbi:hypothetical protein RI129_001304 [Pyrocoelia pectoralis]|uniref:SMP-30/Gluconolactonase/LRE-like region domain-containing protein n=1 Tax=Pyrocoelia pectoralis TaxID=417401 RepID=A0AAN7VJF6_9COLE
MSFTENYGSITEALVIEAVEELGGFTFGEGPHWDDKTQSLFFVDLVGKSIHKFVPSVRRHSRIKFDEVPSIIIPLSGCSDRFLITLNRRIAILTWDGINSTPTSIETVAVVDQEPGLESNRINDGKADHLGNLWAGTMGADAFPTGPITGRLFSMNSTKDVRYYRSNIGVSNGIAWSKDLKKMYYIDSITRVIDQYDFDASNRMISNRQILFSLEMHQIPGVPDGQTIDTDDNLWVAVFDGSRVIKISTDIPETLLYTVYLPAQFIASVAFGGPNLDELYVTGADKDMNGKVYKVTGLGVRGLPANRIKI